MGHTYGQYPCDSNFTVTVLINCLERISPLPKVLWVTVLDRIRVCSFFYGTKWDIQEGMCTDYVLHVHGRSNTFLLVRHTDEDVNQMFS